MVHAVNEVARRSAPVPSRPPLVIGDPCIKTISARLGGNAERVLRMIGRSRDEPAGRYTVGFRGWDASNLCVGYVIARNSEVSERTFDLKLQLLEDREPSIGLFLADDDSHRFRNTFSIVEQAPNTIPIGTRCRLASDSDCLHIATQIIFTWVIGGEAWIRTMREQQAAKKSRPSRRHRRRKGEHKYSF
jgi:hypothetical protein